jgi:CRP/FNR family transcriptional regulator, cyclic AMP receptor protein
MATDMTGLSEEAQSLARVPLFKRLEPHELEKLAEEIDQINYKAGETIFNEHDRGDALYVLEEGSVRIWVTDEDVQPVTLAELQPGAFFGELAVLDQGERSSSATAITDVHLHKLSSNDFQKFLIEHPDCAIDVICEIGTRMRQTNQLVSQRAARNVNVEMEQQYTFGQRVADKVASFGGSWTFLIAFGFVLFGWIGANIFLAWKVAGEPFGDKGTFDPYPFIMLNLVLSCLAAVQAPIIMMSQNRAAEKDRLAAEQDFKVNLKSELMLEELIRKQRTRDVQMDNVTELINSLQEQLKQRS